MSDLVQRLLQYRDSPVSSYPNPLMKEAADRIQSLEQIERHALATTEQLVGRIDDLESELRRSHTRIATMENGLRVIIEECVKAIEALNNNPDTGRCQFAVGFVLGRARLILDGAGESREERRQKREE